MGRVGVGTAAAYGHGALDVAGAAIGAGATGLCVATVPEALALRREFSTTRILVLGPAGNREIGHARDAHLDGSAGHRRLRRIQPIIKASCSP